MPRWLIVLSIVAACTLLVALLRYAIDLLGVVFLIILVGFSIRAVSDWLTEGESVSGWALGAVFAGLFGTVLVGLWLFGPRDMTTGALQRGLPAPILAVSDWLESHGWGQRVLLGGGGSGPMATSAPGASAPLSTSAPPTGRPTPRTERESPTTVGRDLSSQPSSSERKSAARNNTGDAEAATPDSRGSAPRSGSGVPGQQPGSAAAAPQAETTAPAEESQTAADAEPVATTTTVASSHSSSPVGVSVRFTATVMADGTGVPTGSVAFYDGDRVLGAVPVHGTGASVTAVFTTLDLGIGDHEITAEFRGSHGFLGSRSQSISQTITRR